MSETTQSEIIRFGVIFLGFVMLAFTLLALRSGITTGYYKSHVYRRDTEPAAYYRWVVLRAVLGLAAVILGFLLAP